MDYQEAIELLRGEIKCSCYRNRGYCGICTIYSEMDRDNIISACKFAISAIQELQEYKENEKRNFPRTNKLMDECAYRHENGNCLKIGGFCTSVPTSHCQRYKELHNEYTEYKQLGALEEVREAVEKQKVKKISTYVSDTDLKIGNVVFRKGTKAHKCQCGRLVMRGYKFCPECGQRIDWSEKE